MEVSDEEAAFKESSVNEKTGVEMEMPMIQEALFDEKVEGKADVEDENVTVTVDEYNLAVDNNETYAENNSTAEEVADENKGAVMTAVDQAVAVLNR